MTTSMRSPAVCRVSSSQWCQSREPMWASAGPATRAWGSAAWMASAPGMRICCQYCCREPAQNLVRLARYQTSQTEILAAGSAAPPWCRKVLQSGDVARHAGDLGAVGGPARRVGDDGEDRQAALLGGRHQRVVEPPVVDAALRLHGGPDEVDADPADAAALDAVELRGELGAGGGVHVDAERRELLRRQRRRGGERQQGGERQRGRCEGAE